MRVHYCESIRLPFIEDKHTIDLARLRAGTQTQTKQPIFASSLSRQCNVDPVPTSCFRQSAAITASSGVPILGAVKLYALFWARPNIPTDTLPIIQDMAFECILRGLADAVHFLYYHLMDSFLFDIMACLKTSTNTVLNGFDAYSFLVSTIDEMFSEYSGGNLCIGFYEAEKYRHFLSRPQLVESLKRRRAISHFNAGHGMPLDYIGPNTTPDWSFWAGWTPAMFERYWNGIVKNLLLPDIAVVVALDKKVMRP